MANFQKYWHAALSLLAGERCVCCGRMMTEGKLCPRCLLKLPYTHYFGTPGNVVERLFWGQCAIERANAFLHYQPGLSSSPIVRSLKYRHNSELGVELGRMMAQQLSGTDFFADVDAIQPVPLHSNRLYHRGYNQSERIARGVSEVTGLPVVNILQRNVDNVTQTSLKRSSRRDNVTHIFSVNEAVLSAVPLSSSSGRDGEAPAFLAAGSEPVVLRHLLLIDDVITTGSTLISCAQVLQYHFPDLRFSMLSLAVTGHPHHGRLQPDEILDPDATVDNTPFRESQYQPLA